MSWLRKRVLFIWRGLCSCIGCFLMSEDINRYVYIKEKWLGIEKGWEFRSKVIYLGVVIIYGVLFFRWEVGFFYGK